MPFVKKQPVQMEEESNFTTSQSEGKTDTSSSTLVKEDKGIVIEKFIVEITRYPDGKSYSKIYSIGEQKKINKELQKPAKGVTKLDIKNKEIEELE